MHSKEQPLFDLADATDLRGYLEHIFRFETAYTKVVKEAMSYQFAPEHASISHRGLLFEAVMNPGRYNYVKESLRKLAESKRKHALNPSDQRPVEAVGPGPARAKGSLLPHMPPPGKDACPFDNLGISPLAVARLASLGKNYFLVANSSPWGYHHTMLVTMDPEPQTMTEVELRASLRLIERLGPDYEGIFTGVGAGASIYHFHLQVHRGAAVLWRNLDQGRVQLRQFYASGGVLASTGEGWPAAFFVFEASDAKHLPTVVTRMLSTLVQGENDYPCNISFRVHDGKTRLVLFPRLLGSEKPTNVNSFPESWGRFAFREMGGDILLLTPEGYEASRYAPEGLYDAIRQMSISRDEMNNLIRDFQKIT